MIGKLKKWLEPEQRFLGSVFLLAFAIRATYSLSRPENALSPDPFDWISIATRIAGGEGLGGTFRPPGYSAFLAAIFFIFGKSITAARLAQSLLGAGTCLLAYGSARRLYNSLAGRIAAVLVCCYPYFIAYSADLLSETLQAFLLALGTWLLIKTGDEPTWENAALTGAAIAASALTKSVVLPFFFLAGFWLWWRTSSFKTAFLAGFFALLAVFPWSARQYLSGSGSVSAPVSTPWLTLAGSSCDEAFWQEMRGEFDRPQDETMNAPAIPKDWKWLSSLPPAERNTEARARALAWIKANPGKFYYLAYKRFRHFWRLRPMMAWPWQKYAAMATSGIYIPLALLWLLLARSYFRSNSLIIALFCAYTLPHLFFVVTLRYRIPMDTFIIVAASAAAAEGVRRLKLAGKT